MTTTTSAATTLAQEYFAAEALPADVTIDFVRETTENVEFGRDLLVDETTGQSLVFILPNVFSVEECDEIIKLSEQAGYKTPTMGQTGSLRTAKRTEKYINRELSERVTKRLFQALNEKLKSTGDDDQFGDFYQIHENWRMVRYDPGDSFPAHQDQMDTLQVQNTDTGSKDLYVSSHTLLLNLSHDGVIGGCTRFFPHAKVRMTNPPSGMYQPSVDIQVPRGWGIAFRQKGLLHAGQPVAADSPTSKYVAQAGVLRHLGSSGRVQPSVFRLGPGLESQLNQVLQQQERSS